MCAEHWKSYVKGLNAERKARLAAGGEAPAKPVRAKAEPEAATKRERRRTPMASKPAPKPETPRIRKARETLAVTEKLAGQAYTDAIGTDEVQDALETVSGNGHDVASDDMTEEQRGPSRPSRPRPIPAARRGSGRSRTSRATIPTRGPGREPGDSSRVRRMSPWIGTRMR
jgi:hypothetical protein